MTPSAACAGEAIKCRASTLNLQITRDQLRPVPALQLGPHWSPHTVSVPGDACHETRVTVTWRPLSRVTRAPCAAAERILTTVLLSLTVSGSGQPGAGHPPPATRTATTLSSLLPSCYCHTLPRPQPGQTRGRGGNHQADFY